MAKIEIIQQIKHDGQVYHAGETRMVDDKLAGYFCGNGWAKDSSGAIATGDQELGEKTLDIHNGQHATAAPTLGVK